MIKDITKAIVENGAMVRRTLEDVVNINGINYRTDDPDAKQHGVYEYWYDVPNSPAGKKAVATRAIDAAAGTVTETWVYVDLTAEELQAHNNNPLLAQIAALEREQLLPRILRDLAKKSLEQDAAANSITLADLYAMADQGVPAGIAYKKFKDFDDEITALRAALI